mgnify:CR=1 FL=1|uniref:Uncharacterized protein n=1 Tax=viral metagenome TaxID=1070528 RepID=A0A6C0J538_9ZZZZ
MSEEFNISEEDLLPRLPCDNEIASDTYENVITNHIDSAIDAFFDELSEPESLSGSESESLSGSESESLSGSGSDSDSDSESDSDFGTSFESYMLSELYSLKSITTKHSNILVCIYILFIYIQLYIYYIMFCHNSTDASITTSNITDLVIFNPFN